MIYFYSILKSVLYFSHYVFLDILFAVGIRDREAYLHDQRIERAEERSTLSTSTTEILLQSRKMYHSH